MNQTQPETPQTEINPWESTFAGETYVDNRPNPLQPSAALLWMCIGCSVIVKGFVVLKTIWSDPNFNVKLFSYGLPELAMAALMGLGIAMLLHVLLHRRFGQMMPGHWRLIVFGFVMLIEIYSAIFASNMSSEWGHAGPSPLAKLIQGAVTIVFFGIVLWTTRETWPWNIYAGLTMVSSSLMIWRLRVMASTDQLGISDVVRNVIILNLLLNLAILVVLVVAVILDWRRRIPRDLNHQLGIYLVSVVPFMAGFIDRVVEELITLNSV